VLLPAIYALLASDHVDTTTVASADQMGGDDNIVSA
jgi:hypothetical protein